MAEDRSLVVCPSLDTSYRINEGNPTMSSIALIQTPSMLDGTLMGLKLAHWKVRDDSEAAPVPVAGGRFYPSMNRSDNCPTNALPRGIPIGSVTFKLCHFQTIRVWWFHSRWHSLARHHQRLCLSVSFHKPVAPIVSNSIPSSPEVARDFHSLRPCLRLGPKYYQRLL
eukprot:gb/GECG01007594.1/.p1 GENE.gb/GECG01007594.1/~~gb/GECG01007594.1/.p1  ORF type:complete len:168 (+),score=6.45 gb/GECG01007594.1/:1-504(+)